MKYAGRTICNMDTPITLTLQNKMTIEQLASLHMKARDKGFADTDDYVTQLVIADLLSPAKSLPSAKPANNLPVE